MFLLELLRKLLVRLGAGNAAGDRYSDVDQGKLVKLVAESRYDLCAAGDAIEGVVVAVERYVRRLLCWRHLSKKV